MTATGPTLGLVPTLIVRDIDAAREFYTRAFDAETLWVIRLPDGGPVHAELRLGGQPLALVEEAPDEGINSPLSLLGTSVSLQYYVADADAAYARALVVGAVAVRDVADQFYGDRAGTLRDPFGHLWTLATRREILDETELQARALRFFGGDASELP